LEEVYLTLSKKENLTNSLQSLAKKLKELGFFALDREGSTTRSSLNLNSTGFSNDFILDNGSTNHIIHDFSSFSSYKKIDKSIY